ncbi:MAG: 50S ribosomal protein L9 [Treponema sp.]|jgi:large subunit ribosomal protein L9|nr:50S ribosomal protein L9 [Treponema sp.]
MKVILNKDLYPLGEEGDIKDVARGYARNYLFPRGIALPYTDKTVKLFESRREEIEARKAAKRTDAMGVKERLEALDLVITMPAGANGKLYGAVTAQTLVEELAKHDYQTERKRVEIPGNSIKSVGKHKVTVKLYENATAELSITVQAQIVKTETKAAPPRKERRRHGAEAEGASPVSAGAGDTAGAEKPAEEPGQTQPETAEAVRDQEPVAADR